MSGIPNVNFDEFLDLSVAAGGLFRAGCDGVQRICTPKDKKVEFIVYPDKVLAYVKSEMGHPAIYPFKPVKYESPAQVVLMDLDGTSVYSEPFWIWIIEKTVARLLDNPKFQIEHADEPHVSGHSVSEHLQYCINKYCPDKTVEQARQYYLEISRHEMNEIMQGRGRVDAFTPQAGLKEFLYKLKENKIKIGLVTSGLYEKAWPEILSAFKQLNMGDPNEFYDAIITAGSHPGCGQAGTLGELSPKPHPWLYAETSRVGLGIEFADRNSVIGIEDSGAGVCSIRLAGYPTIGFAGGNIIESGARELCTHYCDTFDEILAIMK